MSYAPRLTENCYGVYCTKCGLMGGSSKNDDFYEEVMDMAMDHLHLFDPDHKVCVRKLPRSFKT